MSQRHREHAIRALNGPVPRGHPSDAFPKAGQVPGAASRDNEGTAMSSQGRLGRAESLVYAPPIMDGTPASRVVPSGVESPADRLTGP